MHLNIRSILYKIDQVKMMISQAKIDILCLTETWLTKATTNHELSIDGYAILRYDSISQRGGGILIYIKDNLSYVPVLPDSILSLFLQVEI